jgi:hypothetical protein
MARTTTKPTTKPATKKKAATTKRAASNKTVKRTATKATAAAPAMQSFRPAPAQGPFLTLAITRQTLYWMIIAVLVVGLAAWVLYLQMQIIDIYDSIEQNELLNA